MVDRGLAYLLPKWIPDGGYFSEDREEHLSSLRSNPAAYQVMFLLGLAAWRAWRPDLEPVVERLVRSIRTAFEAFDDQTMPFMRAFHALLMLQHGSGSYIATEVRPRIESLVESQVYRCPTIEGGYGHRDGARGIVTSEANMRGSGAVAIAARFYDLATATNSFGTSVAYLDMAAWIDGMKAEGSGYREYQQDSDGQRRGLGSPGQYIPCWWIFGAL
jgi:hypothetical protein